MASGHGWNTLSKAPLLSLPALLGVFASADTQLKRGNPAGSVLQLVRVTQAAYEEPLKFGLSGAGERLSLAPAFLHPALSDVCCRSAEFPRGRSAAIGSRRCDTSRPASLLCRRRRGMGGRRRDGSLC